MNITIVLFYLYVWQERTKENERKTSIRDKFDVLSTWLCCQLHWRTKRNAYLLSIQLLSTASYCVLKTWNNYVEKWTNVDNNDYNFKILSFYFRTKINY